MRITIVLALLALGAFPSPARAQTYDVGVTRGAWIPGRNELSVQAGYQGTMGGGTPSGAKLYFDYSRRVSTLSWFTMRLAPTFASGPAGTCFDRDGRPYPCGRDLDPNGHALDALLGVKVKFPVERVRLLPHIRFTGGLVGMFNRPAGDNGVAAVFQTGGGLKYFVTPHVGLGGELNLTLGPGFHGETCRGCDNARVELYRAVEFATGVEFLL